MIRAYLQCMLMALVLSAAAMLPTPALAMDDYNQARQLLPHIYANLGPISTFYCSCPLTVTRSGTFRTDIDLCGYRIRSDPQRARRVETEHIMPAWAFGHDLSCWKQGGRKRCGAVSRSFSAMEGDLHNLVPAIGEINANRANFRFAEYEHGQGQYGRCAIHIDFKHRRVSPPPHTRGFIARAYLYMAQRYSIRLSRGQRQLFEAWDRMHAPDEQECARNTIIASVQGNDNPFITARCQSSGSAAPAASW